MAFLRFLEFSFVQVLKGVLGRTVRKGRHEILGSVAYSMFCHKATNSKLEIEPRLTDAEAADELILSILLHVEGISLSSSGWGRLITRVPSEKSTTCWPCGNLYFDASSLPTCG